jgi:hypothetical protein
MRTAAFSPCATPSGLRPHPANRSTTPAVVARSPRLAKRTIPPPNPREESRHECLRASLRRSSPRCNSTQPSHLVARTRSAESPAPPCRLASSRACRLPQPGAGGMVGRPERATFGDRMVKDSRGRLAWASSTCSPSITPRLRCKGSPAVAAASRAAKGASRKNAPAPEGEPDEQRKTEQDAKEAHWVTRLSVREKSSGSRLPQRATGCPGTKWWCL